MERKHDIGRLGCFVAIAFALTYLLAWLGIAPLSQSQDLIGKSIVKLLMAACMFIPALSVVLTRWFTKEGFRHVMIRPHFKGNVATYLWAWFLFPVLTALTALAYFLIFPQRFDPNSGYMAAQYAQAGVSMGPEQLKTAMWGQIALGVALGPVLNCVATFGEEWGWRGYMMPKLLRHLSFPAACLLGGLVWGLWHAPLIALGHNYGTDYVGAPWLGIGLMCLFCMAVGTVFTWWCVKADSCLPAVVAHASINALAGAPLFFVADNDHTLWGPALPGLVGVVLLSLLALALMLAAAKHLPARHTPADTPCGE